MRHVVTFICPLQFFPLTYVGLPPELLRMQNGSDASKQRIPDEIPVRIGKGWAEQQKIAPSTAIKILVQFVVPS